MDFQTVIMEKQIKYVLRNYEVISVREASRGHPYRPFTQMAFVPSNYCTSQIYIHTHSFIKHTNKCTLPVLWPGKTSICFSAEARGLTSHSPFGLSLVSNENSLCIGAGKENT